MPLPPWRSPLSRALHRNRSLANARYLQLATVATNGRPANRTVVFRGFLPETSQLKFITDRRSQKVDQILRSPWGEACWYFPNSREQFRLAGVLTLVCPDYPSLDLLKARQTTWQELSAAARAQFAWPLPGAAWGEEAEFHRSLPDQSAPLNTFCLLLLQPETVDHLELKGNPQNRSRYSLQDGGWVTEAINP
jgi:pyridoxamine 5'-phosphate oxidase